MRKMRVRSVFFYIAILTCTFSFPYIARADCDISASISADPPVIRVSRDLDASQAQARKVKVTWDASKLGCFNKISLTIVVNNNENIPLSDTYRSFDNLPYSGSKSVTYDGPTFEEQYKRQCSEEENSRKVYVNARCRFYPDIKDDNGNSLPFFKGSLLAPQALGRSISYVISEGGGTSVSGRVLICDIFKDDPLSYCFQREGAPGTFIKYPIARFFGPGVSIIDYPERSDIKDMQIRIHPVYAAAQQKYAKYTPRYNGMKNYGSSPLDMFQVTVSARSPRSWKLFDAKVKLMTIKDNKELDLTAPSELYVRGKDGQRIPENTINPEINQWFRTHTPEYIFESDRIDLSGNSEIISAVSNNRPLFFRLYREDFYDINGTKQITKSTLMDKELVLTNCAHIYGEGKNKIINLLGTSLGYTEPGWANSFSVSVENMRDIWEQYEPYKSRKDTFSYYADLDQFDDSRLYTMYNKSNFSYAHNHMGSLQTHSSCPDAILYALATSIPTEAGIGGQADQMGHFLFRVDSPAVYENYIHEAGHALGRLYDTTSGEKRFFLRHHSNCTTKNDLVGAFSYGNNVYTKHYAPGCYEKTALGFKIFSSSDNSIMSYKENKEKKYDTIECGWILSRIEKGSPNSHFPECAKLLSQEVEDVGVLREILRTHLIDEII